MAEYIRSHETLAADRASFKGEQRPLLALLVGEGLHILLQVVDAERDVPRLVTRH